MLGRSPTVSYPMGGYKTSGLRDTHILHGMPREISHCSGGDLAAPQPALRENGGPS